jgi:hypothetical protein
VVRVQFHSKSAKLGMVVHIYNPSTQRRLKQEDHEFEASLGYTKTHWQHISKNPNKMTKPNPILNLDFLGYFLKLTL